jgi:cyclic-di-GMP phosphodiesterase TipF (flagellum assembly factor)
MLKAFKRLPPTLKLLAAGYTALGVMALTALMAPEQAGSVLAILVASFGFLTAINLINEGLSSERLRERLDFVTEQHSLLVEDVARWHRRAAANTENPGTVTAPPVSRTPFVAAANTDTPAIFPKVVSKGPQRFDEVMVEKLLEDSLAHERLDIAVQPVVRLPQRRPAYLEVLARLPRRGNAAPIEASRFFAHVRQTRKVPVVDRLALQYTVKLLTGAHRPHGDLPYMLNIQPETLKDATYMARLVQYLRTNRDLAPRLIFEMPQSSYDAVTAPVRHVMDGLASLGCRFSIDHVENPQFTRRFLVDNHIGFLKLSGNRLAAMARSPNGFSTVQRIKQSLARDGVLMIAESIETENVLMDVLDLGLDYGQGYLFGQPSVVGDTKQQAAA